MPPKKRAKVKQEAPAPDAATSSSSRIPDGVVSSSVEATTSDDGSELFELKFTSLESDDVIESIEFHGCFHIPLILDEGSGLLTVPAPPPGGYIDIKGQAKWKIDTNNGKIAEIGYPFVSKMVARESGSHVIRPGLAATSDIDIQTSVNQFKQIDWNTVPRPADLRHRSEYEFVSKTTVEDFAKKIGGELVFETQDGIEFSLYTVISELRPGQSPGDTIELTLRRAKPNWRLLEEIAKKHPPLQEFDIKAGLLEYRRFLALKILNKDKNSELFAPSPNVDAFWHLHLCFPEQYQQDVLAFAKELKVRDPKMVIQHCPFLSNDSEERYRATLEAFDDDDLQKIVGTKVNKWFWPDMEELFPTTSAGETSGGFGCC